MKKPPYTHCWIDQHSKLRCEFRRAGFKRVPLPGLPWSPEFMAAYELAKAGSQPVQIGAGKTPPGTFSALIVAYYLSPEFRALAPSSARNRRNILERLRGSRTVTGLRVGDCRVAHLKPSHVEAMMTEKTATQAAARVFIKTLRQLMQFAIRQRYRADDPTASIGLPQLKGDGFKSWGEEQISAFEACHPIGSRARLALALLLYTAQRRSDTATDG